MGARLYWVMANTNTPNASGRVCRCHEVRYASFSTGVVYGEYGGREVYWCQPCEEKRVNASTAWWMQGANAEKRDRSTVLDGSKK